MGTTPISASPAPRRRSGVATRALAAAALTLAGVGCSPTERARQSMRDGDPVAAVVLYEEAVHHGHPAPGLLEELSEARREAGAVEAQAARKALRQGHESAALRHATRAAGFDVTHEGLETEVRRTIARRRLEAAHRRMQAGAFARARIEAGAAIRLAPTLEEAVRMIEAIDAAEAAHHRQALYVALESGDRDLAADHLERLLRLEPDDTAREILHHLRQGNDP